VPFIRLKKMAQKRGYVLKSCKQLFIKDINDLEEFCKTIERLEHLCKYQKVRLLVVDDIYRLFFNHNDYIVRAKTYYQISKQLRYLAQKYHLISVLINQAVDVFSDDVLFVKSWHGSVLSENKRMKSSLGLSWSNVINSRIMLVKTKNSIKCLFKLSLKMFYIRLMYELSTNMSL